MQTYTRRRRKVLGGLLAGLLTIAVQAQNSTPKDSTPLPTDLIRGVIMALEATAPDSTRVRFEVCGPDVTRIPRGFPLRFDFNTAIRRVTVTAASPVMAMHTATAAQQVTVSLLRDPFTPPEGWKIAVMIDFEQRPGRGRLTLGDGPGQDIPPPATAPRVVVLGTDCEGIYAGSGETEPNDTLARTYLQPDEQRR